MGKSLIDEVIERISKEENVIINKIPKGDGGFDLDIDNATHSLLRDEQHRIGIRCLQEIFKVRQPDLDVNKDDELMFHLNAVDPNDNISYYQLFHNWIHYNINEEKEFLPTLENETKIFDITNSIANILYLTRCEETTARPFKNIFINCRLYINGKTYYGLYAGNYQDNDEIMTISPVKSDLGYDFVLKSFNINGGYKFNVDEKEIRELLNFYNSFLMFINEPEVILRDIVRSDNNNKRRIERGKQPIPKENFKIILTGELLKYMQKIEMYEHLSYSHKFWVRGHYMHLRNKEKYHNLYSKMKPDIEKLGYSIKDGIISLWRKPFIKGQGILINKTYELK